MFSYSILSSGSKGNAIYIESEKEKLLIDAGLSGKKIENLLKSIDVVPSELTGILVSHEHTDHIQGVGVLSRRYNIPVYANRPTWNEMSPIIKEINSDLKYEFPLETVKTIGDLDIESFGISHDAIMPQFYRIMKDGHSFVILTDTGYLSEKLISKLKNADAYVIEMNHDIEMLRAGNKYSWDLKQRILSDVGHLSNEAGADGALELIGNKTKHLYLGHRSEENNMKELAHEVMKQTLEQNDISTTDVLIHDTYMGKATNKISIDK